MEVILSTIIVYNVLTLGYCQGNLLSQAVLTRNTSTLRVFVCMCSDASSCTTNTWEDLLAKCRELTENIKHETMPERAEATTMPAEETTNPTTTGPVYRGCYKDDSDRVLPNDFINSSRITIDVCRLHCTRKGYSFFGLEAGRECFCGNKIKRGYKKVSDNECNHPCKGDNTEMCGGSWRISVYQVV